MIITQGVREGGTEHKMRTVETAGIQILAHVAGGQILIGETDAGLKVTVTLTADEVKEIIRVERQYQRDALPPPGI